MTSLRSAIAALAVMAGLAAPAGAAVITQEYFEGTYDYGEFFASADGRQVRVQIQGNPFIAKPTPAQQQAFVRTTIAQMQAHKPPPRLTFVEQASEPQRPEYRIVLLFNPSIAGAALRLCGNLDQAESVPPTHGQVVVEIAYCRNEATQSTLKARFDATSADDPRFGTAFDQIFAALLPRYNPIRGERRFPR